MSDKYYDYNGLLKAQEKFYNQFIKFINDLMEHVKGPYVTRKARTIITGYLGILNYHAVKAPKIKSCIYMNLKTDIKNKE